MSKINEILKGRVIFVTGGTGSFGKFFVNEALKKNPKKIIIFSRDEDKQYSMQFEFSKYLDKLKFVIGDVRSKESLFGALTGEKVDILVHAAALKQIPSIEANVFEAVLTNVIGSKNVVDVCRQLKIKKVIGVSTDKAVAPVNAYGFTKGLMEKIFIQNGFSCVRYGNVINSRGSVIPLFTKQLEAKKDLTLTDKNMTRFILTLESASKLVFSAINKMQGGEIFVPKIRPLKIIDLANVMNEKSKSKCKIVEVGVRQGEKIHETLISESEWMYTKEQENYYLITPFDKPRKIKANNFKYSSDQPPFLSKTEITNILQYY